MKPAASTKPGSSFKRLRIAGRPGEGLTGRWPALKRSRAMCRMRSTIVSRPCAEKTSEPWVTLVQFLAATKHKEKASAVIDEARKKLAPEIANLTLGQCYEAVGDLNKAAAELNTALKKSPESVAVIRSLADFLVHHGQPEQAVSYLRKLLEPATRAADSDIVWARRQLALHMARLADFDQFKEALA